MARTVIITTMTTDAALYRLLTWLSPGFPVGAFSYSHALEAAVEAGKVDDRASLIAWLEALLRHGAARSDAILLAETWRAVDRGDHTAFMEIAELAAALRPSRELALESTAQGEAFIKVIRAAWANDTPTRALTRATSPVEGEVESGRHSFAPSPLTGEGWRGGTMTYPVAVGLVAAASGVACRDATIAYLQAFVANIVSAAVRLVPLGQTDGQAALAALELAVLECADRALTASLDDIGGATPVVEILSMRHETQYTRLFRS